MKIERDEMVRKLPCDFSDAPGLAEPRLFGRVERAATRSEYFHVVFYRRVLVPDAFQSKEEALRWVTEEMPKALEAAQLLGGDGED